MTTNLAEPTVSLPVPPRRLGLPRLLVRRMAAVAAVLTLTLSAWPYRGVAVSPTLDGSWVLGTAIWASGHVGGRPVEFTYGPLGFLAYPQAWSRLGLAGALAVTALVQLLLAVGLLRAVLGARGLTLAMSVVGVFAVLWSASWSSLPFAASLEVLLYAGLVLRDRRYVSPALLCAGSAMVTAALFLMKPAAAMPALGALGLVLWDVGGRLNSLPGRVRRRLLLLGSWLAGSVVLTVAGWLVFGGPLANLMPWLRSSYELARGYPSMALEQPGRQVEYLLAAAGVLALVVLLWLTRRSLRWPFVLLLAGFLWVAFKEGFVRHDGHALAFFTALAVAVALVPDGHRVLVFWRGVALGLVGLIALSAAGISLLRLAPAEVVVGNSQEALKLPGRLLDDRQWASAHRADLEKTREAMAIPADVTAQVRSGVQVDPWDVSAAWGYGFTWRPIPVFQLYSAYTPWLDRRNASSALARDAPNVLRRMSYGAIDGRFPLFESPRYQLAVECRYREKARAGDWQLLVPDEDRCGIPQLLSQAELVPGREVTVPEPRNPKSAVVARLTLQPSFAQQSSTLLFKPTMTPRILLDGGVYRFVPEAGSAPLLLRVSPEMPTVPVVPGLNVHRIGFRGYDARGVVEFYEIPVRPAR